MILDTELLNIDCRTSRLTISLEPGGHLLQDKGPSFHAVLKSGVARVLAPPILRERRRLFVYLLKSFFFFGRSKIIYRQVVSCRRMGHWRKQHGFGRRLVSTSLTRTA